MSFATATLSGVFGMAGGLVLMGALALVLPVGAAFATHGILQVAANGWRAVLHRRHVRWPIVGIYALASLVVGAVVLSLAFAPSKPVLFLLMGLVPGILWLPKGWLRLDAARPGHAFLSGLLVTGVNLTAGVAGPLLDIFFVRTALSRHAIVATKAATQVFSHLAKIVVYGAPLLAQPQGGLPPWPVFAAGVGVGLLGTALGGRILDAMSDARFLAWTRLIVTGVGGVYLIQAAWLFAAA